MKTLPVALQLYSLRETFPEMPLKTMKLVKELGFSGVEFYGQHFKNGFYKALLEETGLVCAGWHTSVEDLENDRFEATLERNLAVGNKYIVVRLIRSARTFCTYCDITVVSFQNLLIFKGFAKNKN